MAQLNHKKISRNVLKVGEMIEGYGLGRVSGTSHKTKVGMIPTRGLLALDLSTLKNNLKPLMCRATPPVVFCHTGERQST